MAITGEHVPTPVGAPSPIIKPSDRGNSAEPIQLTRPERRSPRERAWLTPAELAERWGMSDDFVSSEIAGRRIEARKFGRLWKISIAAIEAYEDARPTNMQRGRGRRHG